MELEKIRAQLIRMEEALNYLTAPLMVPSGSVFRLAYQYLQTWFNCFNGNVVPIPFTPELRQWIDGNAETSYMGEWAESSDDMHIAIARATTQAGLGDGNNELNRALAEIFMKYYKQMRDKEVVEVCDVGAGTGDTTTAIIREIHQFESDLSKREAVKLPRIRFNCVEPSPDRLPLFNEKFVFRDTTLVQYNWYKGTDSDWYSVCREGRFDFVVSNAVFHHKVFPEHFEDIRRILTESGVLIFGDWYTPIWSHPALLVSLLRDLGICNDGIIEFYSKFNLDEKSYEDKYKEMGEGEKIAYNQMRGFIKALGKEFHRLKEEWRKKREKRQREAEERGGEYERKETKEREPVICFLEGHEERKYREKKLDVCGFKVDEIREIYPVGEFASVIAASKKPAPDMLDKEDGTFSREDAFYPRRKQSSGVNRKIPGVPSRSAESGRKQPRRKKAFA